MTDTEMVTETMRTKNEPQDTPYAQSRFPRDREERNLGISILLVAISDYRGLDKEIHADAAKFLYPRSRAWRLQYAWVSALAQPNVNPRWLREQLDLRRSAWDAQRLARKGLPGRARRVAAESRMRRTVVE